MEGRVELWRATPGAEARVKAAEALFDDPVDPAATRRFLENEANHLVIAYVDDVPAGFVSGTELVHPDKAAPGLFLNELGVATPYRGRGIGRALVAELWSIARSRGCCEMWVLTDETNAAANAVYRAAGGVRTHDQVLYEWGTG